VKSTFEIQKQLREIAKLKAIGRSKSGRVNPLRSTKKSLRKSGKESSRDNTKIEGIEEEEISQRKSEGECLRCAWPSDRKGTHLFKDCIRPVKLDKGTASYPRGRTYKKQQPSDSSSSSKEEEI
jgi:hypothetical protein